MIHCYSSKINNFGEKSLNNFNSYNDRFSYIQSLMPDISCLHKNVCPFCHAKNKLIKYGSYHRNFSILYGNSIENYYIRVNRVLCKSCLHTHALLPNFIIPYKIMAIFSISKIVQKATTSSSDRKCVLRENKSGCEEIINESNKSNFGPKNTKILLVNFILIIFGLLLD